MLADEILNDLDAIFKILSHVYQPLTNNEAERALLHLVMLHMILQDFHNQMVRVYLVFTINIIETCRIP